MPEEHMSMAHELDGKPAIAGGDPAFEDFLVFGKPWIGEEEVSAVADVIRSTWLGMGDRCIEFEARFAEFVGAEHAVSVASCTAALHLALVCAGVGPGDEVITTTLTFVATVNAIVHTGATPVLADVDDATLNISLDSVRERITPRTKAIVPVHFAGLPCDLDALNELAREHDLVIIEDAAHALGATLRDRPIGSSGIVCFSFYPNKNITTGEGGMITTSDAELAERMRVLRLHGLSRDAWQRFRSKRVVFSDAIDAGFKYNMTDIQAALGLVQLGRLPWFMERRRELAAAYEEGLAGIPGLRIRPVPADLPVEHAWHLYLVQVDERAFGMDRDRVLEALRAENIGAGIHYRAVHVHPYYARTLGLGEKELPVASKLSGEILSLPLSPTMEVADVHRVAGAIQRLQRFASSAS